jgi:hypothetical protein
MHMVRNDQEARIREAAYMPFSSLSQGSRGPCFCQRAECHEIPHTHVSGLRVFATPISGHPSMACVLHRAKSDIFCHYRERSDNGGPGLTSKWILLTRAVGPDFFAL